MAADGDRERYGLQVRILHVGDLETDTEVMLPGLDDGGRMVFPVCAYLVVCPDGRHVLVDTGMNDAHADDPGRTWRGSLLADAISPRVSAADTLERQLAAAGVGVDEVADVVNTHAHFDHVGNDMMFPNARIHVQREQLAAVRERPQSYPGYDLDPARIQELDGPAVIRPGITVIPSPGHVPGHQSVRIELDHSPAVILAGDAIPFAASFELDNWLAHDEPAQARASAHALRERAAAEGAILVHSHDAEQLRTLPDVLS